MNSLSGGKFGGGLVRCEAATGGQVFLVRGQYRHWISDGEWLAENNFSMLDVKDVDQSEFAPLLPGRAVAPSFSGSLAAARSRNSSILMRGWACSFAIGSGIEIGAGANPLPIPLSSEVAYADRFTPDELSADSYFSHDPEMVKPSLQLDLQSFNPSTFEKVDFVASSHAIEHVRDPIGAIVNLAKILKSGGTIILIVPDATRTFDRHREITKVEHLVSDFFSPSVIRDKQHFYDYYKNVRQLEGEALKQEAEARSSEMYPIHYHTWTYESFGNMLAWINSEFNLFSEIKSCPTLPQETNCIEFYYVLKARA